MLSDSSIVPSQATELRIYPSFTEIRQEYDAPKSFKFYFPQDVFNSITHGSLSVEGIPVQSKQIVTKTNNLENKTVYVRFGMQAEPTECRVVRADDLLLQDVTSKRYFSGRDHKLEYVIIPEQEGTEITYILENSGKITVSYMVQGINWSPQYFLDVLSEDGQHSFQGFANIVNHTKQEFDVNRTELISGEANLQIPNNTRFGLRRFRRSRSRSRSRSLSDSSLRDNEEDEDRVFSRAAPAIDSLPELGGLYFYSIDRAFHLLAKSTFCLPFNSATIRLNKFVGLTLPFTTKQSQIGKMKRKYRVESIDKFVPAGSLTIREQGRLIGTTNLPDLAVGDKQIIICGDDPDVSVNRQLRLISKDKNSFTYNLQLRFKNFKSRPVKFEYRELINSERAQFTIVPKGTDEQQSQIRSTITGVQLEANNGTDDHFLVLAANGGELAFEFEVQLNYHKQMKGGKRKKVLEYCD